MNRKLSGVLAWLLQATGVALLVLGFLLVPEPAFGGGGGGPPPCGGRVVGGGNCASGICTLVLQTKCGQVPASGCQAVPNCQCTCQPDGSGYCGCY